MPYLLWTEALRRIIMQGLWQERDLAQPPHISEPLEALLPEMRDLFVHAEQDEVVENARERESGRARPDQSSPYQYPEHVRLLEAVCELLTTLSASLPLLIA